MAEDRIPTSKWLVRRLRLGGFLRPLSKEYTHAVAQTAASVAVLVAATEWPSGEVHTVTTYRGDITIVGNKHSIHLEFGPEYDGCYPKDFLKDVAAAYKEVVEVEGLPPIRDPASRWR